MDKKPPKGIKRVDDAVMSDPNNDYYNPEKNFNTGEAVSVVMIGGKPVKVQNGQVISPDGVKTEDQVKFENGDNGKLDMGDIKARIIGEDD